jgi:hypothetical protein
VPLTAPAAAAEISDDHNRMAKKRNHATNANRRRGVGVVVVGNDQKGTCV